MKVSFVAVVCISLLSLLGASGLNASHKFEDELRQAIESGRPLVRAIAVLEPIDISAAVSWGDLNAGEIEYLRKQKTLESQGPVQRFIEDTYQYGSEWDIVEYKFFWGTNSISLEASPMVLRDLARFDQVRKVIYDDTVQLTYRVDEDQAPQDYTYGLEMIELPQVHHEYPDYRGQGMVIGVLDTGIDPDHPEFEGRVVAFRDFVDRKSEPYDDNGHGTHVAGTAAGSGAGGTHIGVAPEASLVVGRILGGRGGGSLSGILLGMEWITNPDRRLNSRLRPHVVNNSWGSNRFNGDLRRNPFAQHVITWMEMGIFPVFAAGNSGSRAGTIGDPAGLPMAYAIGATNERDEVASFSSRGPVTIRDFDGQERVLIKPDLSAPGERVYSAVPGGGYRRFSGTSMAAPHVAGAVAILKQRHPDLSIHQIIQLMEDTADYLGDSPEREKSNHFGKGRLNLYRAMTSMSSYGFW